MDSFFEYFPFNHDLLLARLVSVVVVGKYSLKIRLKFAASENPTLIASRFIE